VPSANELVLLAAESYWYYRRSGSQPLPTTIYPLSAGWTLRGISSLDTDNVRGDGIYTDLGNGFSATVFQKDGEYVAGAQAPPPPRPANDNAAALAEAA
jgi:hypothetical protein